MLSSGHQGTEAAGSLRGTELAEGLGFDLADAFAGDVELLADLFERVLALAADSEAHPDDFLFLRGKGLQNTRSLVADIRLDHGIDRRADPAVLDQVAQGGFAVTADRSLERHRVTRDRLQLLNLLDRDVHPAADFVVGRRAT